MSQKVADRLLGLKQILERFDRLLQDAGFQPFAEAHRAKLRDEYTKWQTQFLQEQCSSQELCRDPKYGASPLHFAVWSGNEESTRVLIDVRADLNAVDNDGQTPWAWAEIKGDETMMAILMEAGAGPSQVLSLAIEPSPGEILLS